MEAPRTEWSLDLIGLKIHGREASGTENRIYQKVEGSPGRAEVKGKDIQSLKTLTGAYMGDDLAPGYGGPCVPQGACAGSRSAGALGSLGRP